MKPKFPLNLTGLKFGRLTVISETIKQNHRTHWLCKCDCGKEKVIARPNLVSNKTSSCGCIKAEQNAKARKAPGENLRNRLYQQYEISAKRRGFQFLLTKHEFEKLISQNCTYCGTPPNTVREKKGAYGKLVLTE